MRNVRGYMKVFQGKSTTQTAESSNATILVYEDARFVSWETGWLYVKRGEDDCIARFPPGEWAGVELF